MIEIDMHLEVKTENETISAYCYGVYNGHDYIYIATENTVQRHALSDLTLPPNIWSRNTKQIGSVGPFMVADETFLVTNPILR